MMHWCCSWTCNGLHHPTGQQLWSSAHGSRPWDSIDPMATAQLIESLNTVVSRRINIINNPAVISVGMVKAGTRNNIIQIIPIWNN